MSELRVPEEVVAALGEDPERAALEVLLLHLIRTGKVSVAWAGDTLGVLLALHYASQARRILVEDLDALDGAGMYLTTALKRRMIDRFHTGETPN